MLHARIYGWTRLGSIRPRVGPSFTTRHASSYSVLRATTARPWDQSWGNTDPPRESYVISVAPDKGPLMRGLDRHERDPGTVGRPSLDRNTASIHRLCGSKGHTLVLGSVAPSTAGKSKGVKLGSFIEHGHRPGRRTRTSKQGMRSRCRAS